ncbi:thioredoxin family protein [Chromobacterium sp. ASV23]|uniref:DUF1223 domain-containing protein n=1 Tax=Chromobacterium sp. ASV23 TaxID=2795110 RepID=UPI0018EE1A79|nr:DUF1223 domain-containing protein [Chromobacterium sp. ASV23]
MRHFCYVVAGLLGGLGAMAQVDAAQSCRGQSESAAASQVSLLELYTSEGCSSCPPADAWLSGLGAAGIGLRQLVPLAFHVDYWDGLGWRDRFANPAYSRRQRELAARAGSDLIYTPQLRLNGQDWSAGSYGSLRGQLSPGVAQASLRLALTPAGEGIDVDIEVSLLPGAPASPQLMLALYENHLQSQVAAGENAGRLLRHDAVVRVLDGPLPLSGKTARIHRHLAFAPGQRAAFSGAAAWLEDKAGRTIQAVAAPCAAG